MKPHIAMVAVVVRDYDEAIAWYRDAMGFELLEDEDRGDNLWLQAMIRDALGDPEPTDQDIGRMRSVGQFVDGRHELVAVADGGRPVEEPSLHVDHEQRGRHPGRLVVRGHLHTASLQCGCAGCGPGQGPHAGSRDATMSGSPHSCAETHSVGVRGGT